MELNHTEILQGNELSNGCWIHGNRKKWSRAATDWILKVQSPKVKRPAWVIEFNSLSRLPMHPLRKPNHRYNLCKPHTRSECNWWNPAKLHKKRAPKKGREKETGGKDQSPGRQTAQKTQLDYFNCKIWSIELRYIHCWLALTKWRITILKAFSFLGMLII